jgi:hypothetical protein
VVPLLRATVSPIPAPCRELAVVVDDQAKSVERLCTRSSDYRGQQIAARSAWLWDELRRVRLESLGNFNTFSIPKSSHTRTRLRDLARIERDVVSFSWSYPFC